jgi:hypothetical protein
MELVCHKHLHSCFFFVACFITFNHNQELATQGLCGTLILLHFRYTLWEQFGQVARGAVICK